MGTHFINTTSSHPIHPGFYLLPNVSEIMGAMWACNKNATLQATYGAFIFPGNKLNHHSPLSPSPFFLLWIALALCTSAACSAYCDIAVIAPLDFISQLWLFLPAKNFLLSHFELYTNLDNFANGTTLFNSIIVTNQFWHANFDTTTLWHANYDTPICDCIYVYLNLAYCWYRCRLTHKKKFHFLLGAPT